MRNNCQVHFKALLSIVINTMMSTREVLSEGLGADDAGGVVDVLHRDVSVVPDVLHLWGSWCQRKYFIWWQSFDDLQEESIQNPSSDLRVKRTFLRSLWGSFRALMIRAAAEGHTAICWDWQLWFCCCLCSRWWQRLHVLQLLIFLLVAILLLLLLIMFCSPWPACSGRSAGRWSSSPSSPQLPWRCPHLGWGFYNFWPFFYNDQDFGGIGKGLFAYCHLWSVEGCGGKLWKSFTM